MLIVCPNCATSYRVVAENLGESGRSVRCVNCHHVWFEETHAPEAQAATFSADIGAPGFGSAAMDSWQPGSPFPEDPEPILRQLIRPPLNDVVDIGDTPYLQTDPGERAEPGGYFAEAESALHPDTGIAQTGAPSIVPDHSDTDTSVERVAARRSFRRPKSQRRRLFTASAAMPALICVLVLVLGGLVFLRQKVVRYLPQTASLYAALGMPVNLRGLQFDNIKTVRETQDGVPVLVVEGDIVGTGGRLTEVPRLRFAVLDRAGKEIYAWTARPERTLLPAGETLPFRSRLASPPSEASGITVRFFNRHDAKAGIM